MAAASSRDSLTGPVDGVASPSLQGELERILLEAQLECERTKDRSAPRAAVHERVCACVHVLVFVGVSLGIGGGGPMGDFEIPLSRFHPRCPLTPVPSPPQVATPQTSTSPRPSSEHDSSSTDCVTIQVTTTPPSAPEPASWGWL